MKRIVFVVLALSVSAVQAGITNAHPTSAQPAAVVIAESTNASHAAAPAMLVAPIASTNAPAGSGQELTTQPPDLTPLLDSLPKPNEMILGKYKISGIFVEAMKIDQPLQLINPFASQKYGSPEDNVLRDALTGKVSALKIFSFHF